MLGAYPFSQKMPAAWMKLASHSEGAFLRLEGRFLLKKAISPLHLDSQSKLQGHHKGNWHIDSHQDLASGTSYTAAK